MWFLQFVSFGFWFLCVLLGWFLCVLLGVDSVFLEWFLIFVLFMFLLLYCLGCDFLVFFFCFKLEITRWLWFAQPMIRAIRFDPNGCGSILCSLEPIGLGADQPKTRSNLTCGRPYWQIHTSTLKYTISSYYISFLMTDFIIGAFTGTTLVTFGRETPLLFFCRSQTHSRWISFE